MACCFLISESGLLRDRLKNSTEIGRYWWCEYTSLELFLSRSLLFFGQSFLPDSDSVLFGSCFMLFIFYAPSLLFWGPYFINRMSSLIYSCEMRFLDDLLNSIGWAYFGSGVWWWCYWWLCLAAFISYCVRTFIFFKSCFSNCSMSRRNAGVLSSSWSYISWS